MVIKVPFSECDSIMAHGPCVSYKNIFVIPCQDGEFTFDDHGEKYIICWRLVMFCHKLIL